MQISKTFSVNLFVELQATYLKPKEVHKQFYEKINC